MKGVHPGWLETQPFTGFTPASRSEVSKIPPSLKAPDRRFQKFPASAVAGQALVGFRCAAHDGTPAPT